ncbi:MAG: hypothetical protein HKN78_08215 [Sphingomonadaceae bacterium]|nr:hypothetical protein [Sphingomonadaceae bacterium]
MNHWPFIIAAYALTIGGTMLLAIWSYAAMRASENKVAALRKDRPE